MNKIWLIIKREYITRVRKRAFLVTTLLIPVVFVVATFGIAYISSSSEENLTIAVKDDSDLFENKIRGLDKSNLNFIYFGTDKMIKDSLLVTYESMNFDGLLYIPHFDMDQLSNQGYLPQLSYYSSQAVGVKTKFYIEAELSEVIWAGLIKAVALEDDFLAKLDQKLEIQSIIGGAEEAASRSEIATIIGYLMAFIIYIYLIAYGAMVMRSIMEEKTNRIIEVIITTVKPFQLMMGKILGIGAVGLTQLIIWGVLFSGLYLAAGLIFGPELAANSQTMTTSAEMSQISPEQTEEMIQSIMIGITNVNWIRVSLSFIFYFFFGYILYASQFAAIGAAATDDGDVQVLMYPIYIPIVIAIVIMTTTIEQPNSSIAFWSSIIPFTAPVVMMARVPFEIPWWEQVLSMVILFGSSIGMVWLAGKIYRIGILIQGQKVSFKKLWKWMRS